MVQQPKRLAMNFPTPPSFHDPLLFPTTSTTPSSSAAPAARQHQPLSSREQTGLPIQSQQQHQLQPPLLPAPPPPPQAQSQSQSQSQSQLIMNGMNGGNLPGAMVGFPTPAGHQAELNYIYGMVEELSRQLSQNQRALEDVVSGVGRVRTRARSQSLGNEELINSAAEEVKAQEANLDSLISLLSEALEKAKFSRDANAALLAQYATVLSSMLKQFHDYKAKHVADVASWHRSYRAQLAEARAENCRLREQIWEMQAHAGKANEMLRKFRTKFDDNAARWDRRVDAKAARQELRFWKRMALPDLAEDDPYWSDDDDLIDWAEKFRLREIARKVEDQKMRDAAKQAGGVGVGVDGDAGSPPPESMEISEMIQVLGGVPMQREDSGASSGPVPPPRPSSAAGSSVSSTGSTGQ